MDRHRCDSDLDPSLTIRTVQGAFYACLWLLSYWKIHNLWQRHLVEHCTPKHLDNLQISWCPALPEAAKQPYSIIKPPHGWFQGGCYFPWMPNLVVSKHRKTPLLETKKACLNFSKTHLNKPKSWGKGSVDQWIKIGTLWQYRFGFTDKLFIISMKITPSLQSKMGGAW